MSEISRFFGIVISIYFREHGVSHFHVKYGEYRGAFSIDDLELIEGFLPNRVISLVLEWAFQHREQLREDWMFAKSFQPVKKIEPLK